MRGRNLRVSSSSGDDTGRLLWIGPVLQAIWRDKWSLDAWFVRGVAAGLRIGRLDLVWFL